MTPRLRQRSAITLVALLLGGCAVGPDFHRPHPETTDSYIPGKLATHDNDQVFVRGLDIPGQWWELFHSSALDSLRWCRLVGQFRGSDKLFPVDLHAALRASAAGAGAGACPGTSAGSGRA